LGREHGLRTAFGPFTADAAIISAGDAVLQKRTGFNAFETASNTRKFGHARTS
jgi:hypothetical protein